MLCPLCHACRYPAVGPAGRGVSDVECRAVAHAETRYKVFCWILLTEEKRRDTIYYHR